MLCLGPGHSSLLHLTRANAEKPYAGDTQTKIFALMRIRIQLPEMMLTHADPDPQPCTNEYVYREK
jgi:hypothetical protein